MKKKLGSKKSKLNLHKFRDDYDQGNDQLVIFFWLNMFWFSNNVSFVYVLHLFKSSDVLI